MEKKGKFIVLEGGEGSGKSTCIEALRERLPLIFGTHACLFTREPGGTPAGEVIRRILMAKYLDLRSMQPLTELMLFCAARAEHVETVINPALQNGTHVVCDRFDASTIAYQIDGPERKDMWGNFQTLNALAIGHRKVFHQWMGGPHPDMYIILDVDPWVGLERTKEAKGEDTTRFDEKEMAFHVRVRESFLHFAQIHSGCTTVIDAGMAQEDVVKEVFDIVLSVIDS
ncbi:MAG: dTMP kinase [Patescibacteria group bacterium]|nr:dTMP kinase [Patescibacteria group bacterium]